MKIAAPSTLVVASLAAASAMVVDKRASNIVCDVDNKITGILKVSDGVETYNAALDTTTTKDSQGRKSKVLVTKHDDGSALDGQAFDFIPCSSDWMGYSRRCRDPRGRGCYFGRRAGVTREQFTNKQRAVAEARTAPAVIDPVEDPEPIENDTILYGHLVKSGAVNHCIQTKSGSVKSPSQVLTHSICSFTDDSSQLQNTFALNEGTGAITFVGSKQYGVHHPVSLSVSKKGHSAVILNPTDNQNGAFLTLQSSSDE